jgi:hypothetical protein
LVLGDNSEVKVNELVQLNVRFMTKRSQVTLKDIEFRVIPGDAAEILIGKSEIQRLGLPSIESLLDDVAVRLEEEKATEGYTEKVPGIKSETLEEKVVNPVVREATNNGEVREKEGSFDLTEFATSRDDKTLGVKDLRQPKTDISEERRAELMKKHKERVIELRRQETLPLYVEKEQEVQMVKHKLATSDKGQKADIKDTQMVSIQGPRRLEDDSSMKLEVPGAAEELQHDSVLDGMDTSTSDRAVTLASGGANGVQEPSVPPADQPTAGEQRESARVIRENPADRGGDKGVARGQRQREVVYMDDVVYLRPLQGKKGWRKRPPRPGRARPVPAAGGRKPPPGRRDGSRRKGRPPEELLSKILRACAATGMVAAIDLGPYYFHARVAITPLGPPAPRQGQLNMHCDSDGSAGAESDGTAVQGQRDDGPAPEGLGGDAKSPMLKRDYWDLRAKRIKGIQCYGCGGRHKMKSCGITTASMQERIWKLLGRRDASIGKQRGQEEEEEAEAAAAVVPVRGAEDCTESRLWQDKIAGTADSETVGRCVIICGRCLGRGHSVDDCTAPQEKVYNPRHCAIHEPALRKELERHGKKWGVAGASWEDPEWRLPPVPNKEAESSDMDSDLPTMARDGDMEHRIG